jgi:uncharacterized protein
MVSEDLVKQIFTSFENGEDLTFFSHVADNVTGTITGTDNPLYGHYTGKETSFKIIGRLASCMATPMVRKISNILVCGNWAVVEITGEAIAKNGMDYFMEWCWMCRFDGETIIEMKSYMDSALTKKILDGNE